ncbi:hypothetical protein GJ496_008824 [Pomphorhynchus laevis]|nr:hypothetical protein GJ496_008824 [Pomphorhynchus laevis]
MRIKEVPAMIDYRKFEKLKRVSILTNSIFLGVAVIVYYKINRINKNNMKNKLALKQDDYLDEASLKNYWKYKEIISQSTYVDNPDNKC